MSQALRKLTGVASRANCLIIFINQLREKIGVMFGSPETTTGGKALKFYASVRLDIRKISPIKQGEDTIGSRVKAKVVKNKLAPPFRTVEFDILFDRGISWTGDVLDLACEHGIIQKSGAWFSHGDQRLGQGRENTVQYLAENASVLADIESELIAKLFPPEGAAVPPATVAAESAPTAPAPPPNGGSKRERGEKKS
jgi:recombination protein RecA